VAGAAVDVPTAGVPVPLGAALSSAQTGVQAIRTAGIPRVSMVFLRQTKQPPFCTPRSVNVVTSSNHEISQAEILIIIFLSMSQPEPYGLKQNTRQAINLKPLQQGCGTYITRMSESRIFK
jgi:hypothetical protein